MPRSLRARFPTHFSERRTVERQRREWARRITDGSARVSSDRPGVNTMDLVIDMFTQETAETEGRLTETVRRLVADARPELSARVASSDSSAYLDPLLLAYFQATED